MPDIIGRTADMEDMEQILIAMGYTDVVPKSEVHDDHHKQVACYTLGCREGDKIKREVAREIFEEMRREIKAALKSNYKARDERLSRPKVDAADEFVSYCDGKIHALRGIDDFIDELEMKYTEGAEI
jgi:hypothetical protein